MPLKRRYLTLRLRWWFVLWYQPKPNISSQERIFVRLAPVACASHSDWLIELFASATIDPLLGLGAYDPQLKMSIIIILHWYLFSCPQEYTVFGYFRQYWSDKRFASKSQETIMLKGSTVEQAWKPDTYISNSRESNLRQRDSESETALFVYPKGEVFYSKGSVTISYVLMLFVFHTCI